MSTSSSVPNRLVVGTRGRIDNDRRRRDRRGRFVARAVEDASSEEAPSEEVQKVRWNVIRARAVAATRIVRGNDGTDASRTLRKALRSGWRGGIGYGESDDDGGGVGVSSFSLGNDERRAIADATLGSEVWRLRLNKEVEWIKACGGDDEQIMETVRQVEAACRADDDGAVEAGMAVLAYWCGVGSNDSGGARPSVETLREMYGDGVDAIARIIREENVPWSTDSVQRISERCSLPLDLARMFIDEYGADQAERLASAMNEKGPLICRANGAKEGVRKEDVIDMLRAEPGVGRIEPSFANLAPRAFRLVDGAPSGGGIFGSRAWQNGFFEVQDEGSQVIANAVEASPGDVILDACAGNGGKTLAMAGEMRGRGEIYAHDVDARRLKHLLANAERAGVRPLIVPTSPEALDELPDRTFDAILVDAPCSSVGALRRTPSLRYAHDDPRVLAATQSGILERVCRLLKPGGRLVYATCSVVSIENQNVARGFEERHEDFIPWAFERRVPTCEGVSLEAHEQLMLPHVLGTDGFYVARYKRRV
jgi:16S rRNA (cytosine967-C5)-methyltransferase